MINNKPIILEFNGLPGTGKSTIANILRVLLEEEGYTVTRGYYHRVWEKYHYPFLIIPYSFSLYRFICHFSDSIVPYRKRTHQTGVMYYTRAYKKAKDFCKADFIIIDQGVIQDLSTIAWLDRLQPYNKSLLLKVLNRINKLGVVFHRVDCISNVGLSMERINSRPQKNHYFERLSTDELKDALLIQAHNFDYIRKACSEAFPEQQIIQIDTGIPPKENAIQIKNFILSNC